MIEIKERYHFSGSLLIAGFGRPVIILDSGGIETYNEMRCDAERTLIIGVDNI